MKVVVLGSGCAKCRITTATIENVAKELNIEVELSKITDHEEIQRLGVTATPAVMVDGVIVHSGRIPSPQKVQTWLSPKPLDLLVHPTRHLFFTGKGGVGKTSLSSAVALYLADAGKRVLLVSTDAASNLDEMLDVELSNTATTVPGAQGLSVLNIDPDNAAQAYRQRVVDQINGRRRQRDATGHGARAAVGGGAPLKSRRSMSSRLCFRMKINAMTISC